MADYSKIPSVIIEIEIVTATKTYTKKLYPSYVNGARYPVACRASVSEIFEKKSLRIDSKYVIPTSSIIHIKELTREPCEVVFERLDAFCWKFLRVDE